MVTIRGGGELLLESLTLGNYSIICESYPLFVKRWILVLQREVNISAMTF